MGVHLALASGSSAVDRPPGPDEGNHRIMTLGFRNITKSEIWRRKDNLLVEETEARGDLSDEEDGVEEPSDPRVANLGIWKMITSYFQYECHYERDCCPAGV